MSSDPARLVLLFLILYVVVCAFATYYLLLRGEWKKVLVGLPLALVVWIALTVVTLPSVEEPLDSFARSPIGFALILILGVGVYPALLYWGKASRRAIVLMGLAWAVIFGYGFLPSSWSELETNNPVRITMDDVWMFVVMGLLLSSFVVGVHDAFKGVSARN